MDIAGRDAQESAFRRAVRDWWEFFGNSWGTLMAGIIVIAIAFLTLMWPGLGSDRQQFWALVIGEASFAAGSFAYYWQRAPFRQRNEARALVAELAKSGQLTITCGPPVYHKETGVPPYSEYIVIPALNIVNGTATPLDLDLDLEIKTHEVTFLQPIESGEIVNVYNSMPRECRGSQQLKQQLKISEGSRAVGFAAFCVDGMSLDIATEDWSNIVRLNLTVTDALLNVQIAEYEVWPSIWRDIFGRVTDAQPAVAASTPTPSPESIPGAASSPTPTTP
jgi:hypothetical protein